MHKSLVSALLAFYVYVSAEGSVSFTDEATRIPERYQANAQPIEPARFECYARASYAFEAKPCTEGDERSQVRDALGW